jgi:hypothetical protein
MSDTACDGAAQPDRAGCCSWFYRVDGRKCGPLSVAEFQAAVRLGFIRPDDLVRPACGGEWVPARSLESFTGSGS